MEALGRLIDLHHNTTAVRYLFEDAENVTFVGVGATSGNYTVQEHNAATGGTSQNLAVITRYWRKTAGGVWVAVTQAAAATFAPDAQGVAVAEVSARKLSDGFKWISCAHATGTTVAVFNDLNVARKPSNLRKLIP